MDTSPIDPALMAIALVVMSVCFLGLVPKAGAKEGKALGWAILIAFFVAFVRLGLDWGSEGAREAWWIIGLDMVSLAILLVAGSMLKFRRRPRPADR